MKFYKSGAPRRKRLGRIFAVLAVLMVIVAGAGFIAVRNVYESNLLPVDSNDQTLISYTVSSGATTNQIAQGLETKGLIKDYRSFVQYVRSNQLDAEIKAGTYKLSKSMSVSDILDIFISGKVAEDLFTIYPGNNISQIKQNLLNTGKYTQQSIDRAFEPELYQGHAALVDLPTGASLEGFLYPDSYQFIDTTKPEDIIRQSLDEMAEALTAEVRAGITNQGLTVYEGIILASIVEREVGAVGVDGQANDNRAKAAQVFISRLNIGMKLQSNATDGYPDNYDTYSIDGLPPEPISNVSISALQAVAKPADTQYLYFVSGSDCVTRFSENEAQHEALKAQFGIAQSEDNCKG
ncbi:endolytic transglycosylase MltG [Candidatus Saccharibacteria bacterium]|nr:endolytic transglycosylase MltG [Candidatus Saccharibacteria bacterium]